MKILLLGYGKEGMSAERFFQEQNAEIEILRDFTRAKLENIDYEKYCLVLRSPSVQPWLADQPSHLPNSNWTSATRYFFDHCPCPIIGVTGTKGKGTTCTMIANLLTALGQKTWLVGNIGVPALDKLNQIQSNDVVVYEMSSFQLWDMTKSPQIAVVLHIEPDHLNIHHDFDDYIMAKANITKHQTAQDACIYYQKNQFSKTIAEKSAGTKIPYPVTSKNPQLKAILDQLKIRGEHNRENAEAALLAVATFYKQNLDDFLKKHLEIIQETFQNYRGLPHRLQFLRKLNNVQYYDDNFSTTLSSTKVALAAFHENERLVLIVGGRDKTNGADLPELAKTIDNQANIQQVILIGESGRILDDLITKKPHKSVSDLTSAVSEAQKAAEEIATDTNMATIVLMSPAAASFDMFESVYDRGAKFQKLVQHLK